MASATPDFSSPPAVRALDVAARAWRCAFVIEFPLARQRFER
jgi:hypothetical protein